MTVPSTKKNKAAARKLRPSAKAAAPAARQRSTKARTTRPKG